MMTEKVLLIRRYKPLIVLRAILYVALVALGIVGDLLCTVENGTFIENNALKLCVLFVGILSLIGLYIFTRKLEVTMHMIKRFYVLTILKALSPAILLLVFTLICGQLASLLFGMGVCLIAMIIAVFDIIMIMHSTRDELAGMDEFNYISYRAHRRLVSSIAVYVALAVSVILYSIMTDDGILVLVLVKLAPITLSLLIYVLIYTKSNKDNKPVIILHILAVYFALMQIIFSFLMGADWAIFAFLGFNSLSSSVISSWLLINYVLYICTFALAPKGS